MGPDNQTLDEWLNLPTVVDNPDAKGTGLFLNVSQREKAVMPDLTYEDCLLIVSEKQPKAFKWVPLEVATLEQILQTQCGQECVRRCMQPGCLCDTDAGVCV